MSPSYINAAASYEWAVIMRMLVGRLIPDALPKLDSTSATNVWHATVSLWLTVAMGGKPDLPDSWIAGLPGHVQHEFVRARTAAEKAQCHYRKMLPYASSFLALMRAWIAAHNPNIADISDASSSPLHRRVAELVRTERSTFDGRIAELFAVAPQDRSEIERTIEEVGLAEFFHEVPLPSSVRRLAEAACWEVAADPAFPYAPPVAEALRTIGSLWIPPESIYVDYVIDSGHSSIAYSVEIGSQVAALKIFKDTTNKDRLANDGPLLASFLLADCVLPRLAGAATDAVVRVLGWSVFVEHPNRDPNIGRPLTGLCIVMERLWGPNLKVALPLWRNRPGERFAAVMAGRLMEAVRALHKLRATHCDLHDENVMFRGAAFDPGAPPEEAARHTVVLDFGRSFRRCHQLDDLLAITQHVRRSLGGAFHDRRPLEDLLNVESLAKRASGEVQSVAAVLRLWAALDAWRRHVMSKPAGRRLLDRCVDAHGGPLPVLTWDDVRTRGETERLQSTIVRLGKERAEGWLKQLPEHERAAVRKVMRDHQEGMYNTQWIRPGQPVVGLVEHDIDGQALDVLRTPTFGTAFADRFFTIPAGGAVLWRGFKEHGPDIVSSADASGILALPPHPASVDPQIAFDFARHDGQGPATVLELHIPAGTPALPIFAFGDSQGKLYKELELVLPPAYYRLDFAGAYRAKQPDPSDGPRLVVPATLVKVGRMLPTRGPPESSGSRTSSLSMSPYLLRPKPGRKRTWTMSSDPGRFVTNDPADPGRIFRQVGVAGGRFSARPCALQR